jgi:hypothetical protein
MKKHLFILGSIITFVASESSAYLMTTTQYGNIPSHVILDKRPVVRALQEAMRNSAGGVQAALAHVEIQDANFTGLIPDLSEGSFSGLKDGTDVAASSGAITFTFDLSEIIPGASMQWTLVYTPQLDGNAIGGWTCVSTAGSSNLGSNYISVSSGIDPVTSGLGWPYAGCEVQS